MDFVDPNYDFIKDKSSPEREPYWDDQYPHEILGYANMCWFQGTKPTKQWERKWISSVSE